MRVRRPALRCALAVLLLGAPGAHAGPGFRAEAARPVGNALWQQDAGSPYYGFQLHPPRRAVGGASGAVAVTFPDNPFGVAVTAGGEYVLDLRVQAFGLRPQPRASYVAWVATPDLQPLRRLGVLREGEALAGRVDFDNKFLVFVTAEPDPGVERPTGRIVLQGVSRSGRMESMFSHGFCPPGEYC